MNGDHPLAKLSAVETMLAQATTVPEIKQVTVITGTALAYARNAKLTFDVRNHAYDLNLKAERKAGAALDQLERNPPGRPKKLSQAEKVSEYERVRQESDITRITADRWVKESRMHSDVIDGYLAKGRTEPDTELTTAGLLEFAKELERQRQKEELVEYAKDHTALDLSKPIYVQPGQWWKLGRHFLYCGDTANDAFLRTAPPMSDIHAINFAFADPPYNAEVATWDHDFVWSHDWIANVAPVVAVTPGIASIQDFMRATAMPYAWSMACWLDNGMTRGALGFGNWVYIALFSDFSLYRNRQDFLRVSINRQDRPSPRFEGFKGRKPLALMRRLLEMFTKENETVLDPFLGSGTTLFVAEQMGRTCIGGEEDPQRCQFILEDWQEATGKPAENLGCELPLVKSMQSSLL
jgi:hypothetical protein